MAVSPSFMDFLTSGSTGSTGTTTTTQKKNPYGLPATTATSPTPGNTPVTPSGTVNPSTPPKTTNVSPNQAATAPAQPDRTAQIQEMMKTNPTQFPNEAAARAWGERYYGWGAATTPATGGGTTGGTGQTVPGLPPPGTVPGYATHLAGVQPYQGTNFGAHTNITYDPTQIIQTMPQMYGAYNQYTPQTQLPGQGYVAGNFGSNPFTQYQGNPGNITQFSGPNQQGVADQQQQLLMQMLQNPYSMSAQNVEQLKAKQRATALALQKGAMSQNADQAAALGRVGGGMHSGLDAAAQNEAMNSILSGYRDIDLRKMTQDREDLTGALNTASGVMDSASARAAQEYAQLLAGQKAREQVGLDTATSAQEAERLGLQRTTASEAARQAQAKSAQDLAALGIDMDKLRQGENQFAFKTEQQKFQDALSALDTERQTAKFNADEGWRGYESAADNQKAALARAIAGAQDKQSVASSGMTLGGMLQDSMNSDAQRQLQERLAQAGFAVDREGLANTSNIAKMNNSTDLMGILLGHQRGMAGLNQADSQFNKTFGLQQQDQTNQLMQWLFGRL